jgi:hypothetical protein
MVAPLLLGTACAIVGCLTALALGAGLPLAAGIYSLTGVAGTLVAGLRAGQVRVRTGVPGGPVPRAGAR